MKTPSFCPSRTCARWMPLLILALALPVSATVAVEPASLVCPAQAVETETQNSSATTARHPLGWSFAALLLGLAVGRKGSDTDKEVA